MNILGIIYQEEFGHPAACILQDGSLVAFAEEERFVRVKQARGYFPGRAIKYCLLTARLTLDDVDFIAFGWDANRYALRYPLFLGRSYLRNTLFKRKEKAKARTRRRKHVGLGGVEQRDRTPAQRRRVMAARAKGLKVPSRSESMLKVQTSLPRS